MLPPYLCGARWSSGVPQSFDRHNNINFWKISLKKLDQAKHHSLTHSQHDFQLSNGGFCVDPGADLCLSRGTNRLKPIA